MMRAVKRIRHDCAGSTIIEFAILAPAIVTLLLGIFQIGMFMQNYNALRSVAADTGRYVAIQYQKGVLLTNDQMGEWAHDRGVDAYMFDDALNTVVEDAATQQIAGVTEKSLKLNYTRESILSIIGIDDQEVTFTRPIFVKAT